MFRNREEAGRQLAESLMSWKQDPNTIVIGLPRGGIPIGYEVCKALNLPMDIVYPKKIGAPGNPEFAIGAVTELGEGMISDWATEAGASKKYIEDERKRQSDIAKERLKKYRKFLPKQNLKGKTVIIVDDGIATGMTLMAAIKSVRSEGAEKIVVAVPVAPYSALKKFEELADEIICLDTPLEFMAVGQFYYDFSQTTDEEVEEILTSLKSPSQF
ncbi:MAG: phosphoribosyltransferase [Chlamydiales bacterium]